MLQDAYELAFHDEPLYSNGRCVDCLTSAAFGHTLGGCVGLGYVEHDEPITQAVLDTLALEVDLGGERWPVRSSLPAIYAVLDRFKGARVAGAAVITACNPLSERLAIEYGQFAFVEVAADGEVMLTFTEHWQR